MTTAVQNYLKTIYGLHLGRERVQTAAIARALGVSPASVTAMLKRLGRDGLLDYERYRGASLTDRGEKAALQVIRRHRITEQFLLKVLGLRWDQVHAEAETLEHALSDALIDRMDELLGHPRTDPHGDPIPTKEGRIERDRSRRLSDLDVGEKGVIQRVSDEDPRLLQYAHSIGLVPRHAVELIGREPFGGPLRIRVEGVDRAVGDAVAGAIFVADVPAKLKGSAGESPTLPD